MHFLFYVVNFSDIILFNILKYHLNCKLFQKNFSLKESLKDTFLNSFKIYNGTYSFRKKKNFAKFGQGNLGKVGIVSSNIFDHPFIKSLFIFFWGFLAQIIWSPCHQITFYIFARLPDSNTWAAESCWQDKKKCGP